MRRSYLSVFLAVVLLLVGQSSAQKPFYCQAPLPGPSENTDGLTLKMVQVLTRHGDRTPLYSTFNNEMDVWNCTLSSYETPSMSNQGNQPEDVNYMFRKVYMPNREYLPGNCSEGQLTSIGYQQHLNLGAAFRELYVYKYQLLSEELDESEIWIRSTDVPRTLQSAQGHINGLYPPSNTKSGAAAATVININTMDDYFENMEPNPDLCPILNKYYDNLTNSQTYISFMEGVKPLKEQLVDLLEISYYGFPEWSSLMDLFFAEQCHGLPLPKGVTEDIVNQVYNASFWSSQYLLSPPIVARLSMSSFLEEVVQNIQDFAQGNTTTKYFIFSGHDDTLGPFMNMFGFYTYWPPYASHIEIEIWEDETNSNQFVQLKYNGEIYTINGCSSSMCPIEEFVSSCYTIMVPGYSDACQYADSSSSWDEKK